MASTPDNLINYLRAVVGAWREDRRSDAELLACFAASRDEMAFRALVWRHGQLVWQVCTRILGDSPDAEDTFQTVFLTLSRNADRLNIKSPAGWLHRVASRAALNANAGMRRRRKLEQHLQSETRLPDSEKDASQVELHTALDEELENLAERLRIPLVLRYLEGKTLAEVAKIVGCSVTAVTKRLTRGETILRKRLTGRGLAAEGGLVAAMLASTARETSALPADLITRTARAAVAFRAGTLTGCAANSAQQLLNTFAVEGVTRKLWWIVLVCVGGLGVGGTGWIAWKYGGGSDTVVPNTPEIVSPMIVRQNHAKEKLDRFGDLLPEGALARIGTIRFRPPVISGHFSGDGIAFLADGKTLVSKSDNCLYFWDRATGKELRRLDAIRGFGIGISRDGFAISRDGKMLAAGGEYWDLAANPPRRLEREMLPSPIEVGTGGCVAFSPDGGTVAWAEEVKQAGQGNSILQLIYLVDASTGKVKGTLEGDKRFLDASTSIGGWHLAFSPDGKTLASGGFSGRTVLWDIATKTKRLQIPGDGNPITFLAFLPDGKTLLESRLTFRELIKCVISFPEKMRFLDAATGAEQRLAGMTPVPNHFCAKTWWGSKSLSPDGKLLALNVGGAISMWDMAADREIGSVGGLAANVTEVAFSPDSKKLVTLTPPFQSRLWETDTGRLEREFPTQAIIEPSISYRDSRYVELFYRLPPYFENTRKNWSLLRWDTKTGKSAEIKEWLSADLVPLLKSLHLYAASPDGRWQALSGATDGIVLVDRATGKEVRRLPELSDMTSMTFTPDGQYVLICADKVDGRMEIWTTATGKQRLGLDMEFPRPCVLSPDGRWLAVGDTVKELIRLREVASGMEASGTETIGLKGRPGVLAWTPDGRWLAGGDGEAIWIWDTIAGREVRRFTGHRSKVESLAFSPDGLRLASGSSDTTALIWDLSSLTHSEVREKDPRTVDGLWEALRETNPATAHRSIHALTQMPDRALPLLRQRLQPLPPRDPKQVTTLLAQLDDDSFLVRHRATEELEKMGDPIESTLRQALTQKLSLEVRKCIQKVLAKISPELPSGLSLGQLQNCRGVEVLERIGTPAARQVLEELSQLPAGLVQAEEAKAALHRLSKPVPASTP